MKPGTMLTASVLMLAIGQAGATATLPQTTATAVTVTNPVTRPIPNQDVDSPLRNSYQQMTATSCSIAGSCGLDFPATTAALTAITHVGCFFSLSTSGAVLNSYLGIASQNPFTPLPLFTYPAFGGSMQYGINTDTYLVYAAGQIPQVVIFGSGATVSGLECTVSGWTVK